MLSDIFGFASPTERLSSSTGDTEEDTREAKQKEPPSPSFENRFLELSTRRKCLAGKASLCCLQSQNGAWCEQVLGMHGFSAVIVSYVHMGDPCNCWP